MPLYEYECQECGLHFDRWQRFDDAGRTACPNGHQQVHRLLSRPAIIFKGTGFYTTDYGRNGGGSAKRAGSRKEPETTASSKSETVADS